MPAPISCWPRLRSVTGIDLAARILEVFVFDEGADLRAEVVIRACHNVPRQISMSSVPDGIEGSTGCIHGETGAGRVVHADAGSDIRLETAKREARMKFDMNAPVLTLPEKSVVLVYAIKTGESATPASLPPVICEVSFNGGTKKPGAKDVACFDPARKSPF